MATAPQRSAPISEQTLKQPHALPHDPVRERVVFWRTFRSTAEAVHYSTHILLSEGQHLVGGSSRDDMGPIYWIGIQVDDLARWGNTKAIQMTHTLDGHDFGPKEST